MAGKASGGEDLKQMLDDAAAIGLSGQDIVSMFSDRHRFGYWRYDGKEVVVAGNFSRKKEDLPLTADGRHPFESKLDDDTRFRLHDAMEAGFAQKKGLTLTYHLHLPGETPKLFRTVGKFRTFPDGSEDLFGVAFECFQEARLIVDAGDEEARKQAVDRLLSDIEEE